MLLLNGFHSYKQKKYIEREIPTATEKDHNCQLIVNEANVRVSENDTEIQEIKLC